MATKAKEQHLPAKIYTQELALQHIDMEAVVTALAESGVEGDGISPFDLDRISMPAGDSLTYNIPGEDGPEPVRFLEALVLHHHPGRQLYKGPYDVNNPSAPICASFDGLTGYGNPGGECIKCPLGAFGGTCYPHRYIYLLFPKRTTPTLLVLPRTSVVAAKRYLRRLALAGHLPYGVITKIGLKKRERGTGMVATFTQGDVLGKEMTAFVRKYAQAFKASLSFPLLSSPGVDPTAEDVSSHNVGPDFDDDEDIYDGPDVGDNPRDY